ncbi:sensor domain-containing protein [Streptacidiphilus neutrinimicus]|uniref:sensor domain-containing protein n=1 Tax=Streptacidiphilus neutrinimicus TaxID=105420 RepID=UPI00069408B4|nr:sensor domain-containing protein [Streptacidiphilus neutrinimicus]
MSTPAILTGRTWRETLHLILDLPLGILSFSYVVALFCFGVGTAMTFLGLPVLVACVGGARGFAAMERARARALLGEDVPAPAPVAASRPGFLGWIRGMLGDGANWRAALYAFLLLPMGVLGFTLAVTLWSVGICAALYPLYHWVFPTYVGWPGYKLWENNGHSHYISSVPEIAATCVAGILLVLLTTQVVKGLAAVRRGMARGLLR